MQGRREQVKIPSAWRPDEWICHHTGNRHSTFMDDYHSKGRSLTASRNFNSPSTPKRISTAKLKRQIENLSLKSAEYRRSAHKSNVKRLTDSLSPKSYKSFLSCPSHRRAVTHAIRIPKMSKQSLKRWLDARDAYLGHQFPYIQERSKRLRRRRRTKSNKKHNKLIDHDEAASLFSVDTARFSVPAPISSGKQRRLSRKDSHVKRMSQSEINLRCSGGLLQRIKSFVQLPIRSLSRLSLRKQTPQIKTRGVTVQDREL